MVKKLVFIFLLVSSLTTQAQDSFHKTYNWDLNPSYTVTNPEKGLVSIKEKIISEFTFEGEKFIEYFLEHRVIYLNSDDAIERYNRVYLPYTQSTQLEANKARVIKKSGEVVELDESKILEAEDEETKRKYKFFAFEGIEKGSIIEYFYIEKRSPRYSGVRMAFQKEYDTQLVEFDLYSPKHLIFDFKSYNGLPEAKRNDDGIEKNRWTFTTTDLAGLEEEPSAAYKAMRGALYYKLQKNAINGMVITSYQNISENYYSFFYPEYKAELQTAIDEFVGKIGVTEDMDVESKLRKIDNYIKANVYSTDIRNPQLADLASVIANKTANEDGMVSLYVAVLRKLGIEHEMVITSDRLEYKLDPEFEAYNFLNEYMLYFPATKKYLAPTNQGTRYGFPPAYWMDNYGLFIKGVDVNGTMQAQSSVRYIDPIPSTVNKDVMLVDVSFDEDDMTTTNINLNESMYGYNAQVIQPFLNLIDKDRINEIIEQLGKIVGDNEDAEVTDHEIVYDDPELFGIKPMQVKYKMSSDVFVNKAGRKYLFKLGDLIGRQVEMYQDKKRILPYEERFQRVYDRVITVNIPEGYKVANLEDINIKNQYEKDGKILFLFHSYYTLEGNKLTVKADEYYTENIVAPELYEEYRTVINSAADFNKITLVLEPK